MRFPIISSVSAVTVAVTALLALEAVGCHPAVSAGAHVSWSAKNAAIRLDVSSDGSYTVSRAGAVWLTSAPVALHVGGEWYVSGTPGADQQALTLTKSTVIQGADKLGRFTGLEDDWAAGETPFVTRFRFYADNGGAVIFEQSLPQGGQGMTVGVSTGGGFHEVSTAFPSFHLSGKTSSLNYLTYDGTFATPTKGVGLQRFPGGTDGGSPLVLYDNQLKTVLLSPYDHFTSLSQTVSRLLGGVLACGLEGQVDSVPAGYDAQTLLVPNTGINNSIMHWGDLILAESGKTREASMQDPSVQYLAYWTDNGAYYYYLTEPQKNYEQTLLDVAADSTAAKIPYHFYQLDSWWYYKGKDGGVSKWDARPDVFPDGLAALRSKLSLPFIMHNRWWSPEAVSADPDSFVAEAKMALPIKQSFWDDLMAKAHTQGDRVYEQDWLVTQAHGLNYLRQHLDAEATWLTQMNDAAAKQRMTIQYCMPLPKHLLESTQLLTVTQARASDDYHPGRSQWKIGATSLLEWSLGLAPFKDDFWTTTDQPGSPYKDKPTEPNVILETIVSSLSAGPVGPSDAVGKENVDLIMRTCRADGLLLKPDRPATPVDAWFLPEGPKGQLWSTETTLGSHRWSYVLDADTTDTYQLPLASLGQTDKALVFHWMTGTTQEVDRKRSVALNPALPTGATVPVDYVVVAPVAKSGWSFLGEAGASPKVVTVSSQRFESVDPSLLGTNVRLAPGESVTLVWHGPKSPESVSVDGTRLPKSDQLSENHWTYNAETGLLTVMVSGGQLVATRVEVGL